MRTVLRGLVVGVLLSVLRAPRGFDLFELPVANASSTLLVRALALALAGIALGCALRRPGAALLASVAAGYALHGLVLAAWIAPESPWTLAATVVLGLVLVLAVCLDERKLDEPPEPAHDNRASFVGELLGLFAAGAGAALAIEGVARHVRPFGAGLAQDDTVFGLAFLLVATLGAFGLGWLARLAPLRNLTAPLGLAGAAVVGAFALRGVTEFAQITTLERYVKGFGLSLSEHGTVPFDLLVGAALLGAPALLAGAAFAGLRTSRQGAAVLFGAAQGLLLVRSVLGAPPAATELREAFAAAQLVQIGSFAAVAGAALAVLSAAGARKLPRYGALAAVFGLALVPLTRETFALPVRAPWDDSNPLSPRLFQITFDLPEGLVTVESRGQTPPVATLDGHALTSGLDDALGELARLRASIGCVASERRAKGGLSALLVGQLDPFRATVLRQLGVTTIDRTAAWHSGMQRVEEVLFKDMTSPDGAVLTPADARARIAEGRYDLVLVPAVDGDLPAHRSIDAPSPTVVVAWLPATAPLAAAELDDEVLLASDGIDTLSVARVVNAERSAQGPEQERPRFVRSGARASRPLPLAELALADHHRFRERALHHRAELLARLRDAARGTKDEDLFAGLEELTRAQVRSSPFETPEQQYELSDAGLEALQRHALANAPDAFVRGVWDGLARVLTGKRDVERVRRFLEPVAHAHAPWLALEKALARADLEALEPAAAAKRLEALGVLGRDDFDYWHLLGDARKAGRDLPGAIQAWRRAYELRSTHQVVKRKLAIALVRQGEPAGRELVEELLKAFPNDAKLAAFLGPGPWPEDDETAR
ncbi:MAG: hypothetical protein IPJ77_04285 [Planctomycetes bacterium]|nr:hypothetical protein [Planctomycetota bacterium]